MNAIVKHVEGRLMKVLIAPIISEKSTFVSEKSGQVMFRVIPDATKLEIKAAVELLFKVEVDSVQVLNRIGKIKRGGKVAGRRNHTRRAYVCLKAGQEISLVGEVK